MVHKKTNTFLVIPIYVHLRKYVYCIKDSLQRVFNIYNHARLHKRLNTSNHKHNFATTATAKSREVCTYHHDHNNMLISLLIGGHKNVSSNATQDFLISMSQ